MPGKELTWFEKLKGKRYSDIELEPESGTVDPRLKGKSVREALDKASKGFKSLQKNAIMRGLYDATGEDRKK